VSLSNAHRYRKLEPLKLNRALTHVNTNLHCDVRKNGLMNACARLHARQKSLLLQ
jgi:hypothetical protein